MSKATPSDAIPSVLGRTRVFGLSAIARELGRSVQYLKKHIRENPDGRLAGLVKEDPADGTPCAFLEEIAAFLDECKDSRFELPPPTIEDEDLEDDEEALDRLVERAEFESNQDAAE